MQKFAEVSRSGMFKYLEKFLDATLRTEDGSSFKVHRLHLALQNHYFRCLFSGYFSEKEDVLLQEIDGNTLGLILQYLYSGRVPLDRDNVMDLWFASDYFLVDALKEDCMSYVLKEMDEENCLELYLTLWRVESLGMVDECFRYLEVHFGNVVLDCYSEDKNISKRRNLDVLRELPFEALKKLLESKTLNTTGERMVWEVIQTWFEKDYYKRLEHVPELLKCFYFEEKDAWLASEITQNLLIQDNPFCKSLLSDAGDTKTQLQPCSKGPRLPPKLHFVAQYCVQFSNNFYLDLYLTFDHKLDIWRKLATNVALCPDFLIQIGHYVYMFDTWENRSMAFNIQDCTRRPIPPINVYRSRYSAVGLDDHIYVMGGITAEFEDTDVIERYDPSTDVWDTIAPMHPMILSEVVVMNGCIYAIGDIGEEQHYSMMVQIHIPASNAWYVVDAPKHFRHDFTSVVYRDRLYVIGGEGLMSSVKTVEEYNSDEDTWVQLPDLPVSFVLPKAVDLDGNLIVYDNHLENRSFAATSQPVVWDPVKYEWNVIDVDSPLHRINFFQFCTISRPEIVRDLTEQNRVPGHEWEKGALV